MPSAAIHYFYERASFMCGGAANWPWVLIIQFMQPNLLLNFVWFCLKVSLVGTGGLNNIFYRSGLKVNMTKRQGLSNTVKVVTTVPCPPKKKIWAIYRSVLTLGKLLVWTLLFLMNYDCDPTGTSQDFRDHFIPCCNILQPLQCSGQAISTHHHGDTTLDL